LRQFLSMSGKIGFRTLIQIVLWSLFLFAIYLIHENRAFAQEHDEPIQQNEKGITFKVQVDEIRIDAVVVDWRGRYVTDLTVEDFKLYQDDQLQEITSCRYISYDQKSLNVNERDVSENPALATAFPTIMKREDVQRTLVFLVDNLIMDFTNVYYARMALRKFVEEQMHPGDLVAILSTSKGYLGPLAFTSDKKQLMKSVQNITKDRISIPATRPDTQYQHMLAAVRYYNSALRHMSGQRSLIWMSQLTRMPDAPPSGELDDNARKWPVIKAFDALADEMLHAGVIFHTMDIRGLEVDDPHLGKGAPLPLSEKTGGLFLENDNFFVDGIGELDEVLKGYYLLTYVPPAGTFASDGSTIPHEIDIKSKGWLSQVRHREKIFTGETMPGITEEPQDSLQEAVTSPFQNNDLPIRLSSGYIRNSGGDSLLRSWFHVDGKELGVKKEENGDLYIAVEALGMVTDSNSRIWDEGRQLYRIPVRKDALPVIRENGLRFSIDIPVKKPGAYYVRVAVKDEGSGKQGSAYQYVEVPDLEKDRLTLSDIFFTRAQGDETKIDGVLSALKPYGQGETIGYRTEIYNARIKKGKSPELEYQYVLYKDGIEVLQSGPRKVDTSNVSDYRKIALSRELRFVDSLEPGTYALQLEVRDNQAKEKDSIAIRWMNFEIMAGIQVGF